MIGSIRSFLQGGFGIRQSCTSATRSSFTTHRKMICETKPNAVAGRLACAPAVQQVAVFPSGCARSNEGLQCDTAGLCFSQSSHTENSSHATSLYCLAYEQLGISH